MSKTYTKVVEAVNTILAAVPPDVSSVIIDLAAIRDHFPGLASTSKRSLRGLIDDVLSLTETSKSHGEFCLAEVEHPRYQLSRIFYDNRITFFKASGGAVVATMVIDKPKTEAHSDEKATTPLSKEPGAVTAFSLAAAKVAALEVLRGAEAIQAIHAEHKKSAKTSKKK